MFISPTIDMVKTGQNIVTLRKKAGLSVRELQIAFGFGTPQAIYKWQQGLAMPNIDNLVVLASLLGVKIDDTIVTDKQNYIKIGAYRMTIDRAVEKKVQREMIKQNYTTSSMT